MIRNPQITFDDRSGSLPRLLYVSAWQDGKPRGGFFSAATLLEHLNGWRPEIMVGARIPLSEVTDRTLLPLVDPGYRLSFSGTTPAARITASMLDTIRLIRLCINRRYARMVADYEVFFPSAFAARILGIPFAFYLRDFAKPGRSRKTRFAKRLSRNGIFLSTSMEAAFLAGDSAQCAFSSYIVPNSFRQLLRPDVSGPPLRGARTRIGLVGALCKKKNQLWFVLNVAPKIPKGAEIHFFGEEVDLDYGRQMREATHNLRLNCVFHGFEENLENIYSQIDLLVQVSGTEGISRAVIEAGIYAIPSVVLNIPGAADYVDHGRTGYLVDSAEELVGCIERFCDEPEMKRNMGISARDWFRRRHHPLEVARRFEEVLNHLQ